MKTVVRGYKYRLKPNAEQKKQLDVMLKECRSFRNRVVSFVRKHRSTSLEWHKEFDIKKMVSIGLIVKYKHFKNTRVPSRSLTTACEILYKQFKYADKLFERPPGYKRPESIHTIHFARECVKAHGDKIAIKNIGGLFDIRWSRRFSFDDVAKIVVSRDIFGEYSISFDVHTSVAECHGSGIVGIDMNVSDVVVTSEGEKFQAAMIPRKTGERIAYLMDRLRELKHGSRAWNKVKRRIYLFTKHADDKRKGLFYKIAHHLSNTSSIIGIEALDIAKIIMSAKYSSSITQSAWGQLRLILRNVCEKRGVTLAIAASYFPSTRLASCCGTLIGKSIPTYVRMWICPKCKTPLDRDINAAVNIAEYVKTHLKTHKHLLSGQPIVIC